eukprot:11058071-Alexandrium_andersonii.AAC.1
MGRAPGPGRRPPTQASPRLVQAVGLRPQMQTEPQSELQPAAYLSRSTASGAVPRATAPTRPIFR